MDNTIEKEATEFASSYKGIEAEVRHAFMCGAKWMLTQYSTLQYNDKTLITEAWLRQHFGLPINGEYVFGETTEVSIKCINPEAGLWRVRSYDTEFGLTEDDNTVSLFTIGQLRMFLAIQGITTLS